MRTGIRTGPAPPPRPHCQGHRSQPLAARGRVLRPHRADCRIDSVALVRSTRSRRTASVHSRVFRRVSEEGGSQSGRPRAGVLWRDPSNSGQTAVERRIAPRSGSRLLAAARIGMGCPPFSRCPPTARLRRRLRRPTRQLIRFVSGPIPYSLSSLLQPRALLGVGIDSLRH